MGCGPTAVPRGITRAVSAKGRKARTATPAPPARRWGPSTAKGSLWSLRTIAWMSDGAAVILRSVVRRGRSGTRGGGGAGGGGGKKKKKRWGAPKSVGGRVGFFVSQKQKPHALPPCQHP